MVMNTRSLTLARAISHPRVRTLVVDNSPLLLKTLTQILAEADDFELVATATDRCQALRHVAALSGSGLTPAISLRIQRWRALRFSPPILIRLRQGRHTLLEAHSARMRSARVWSGTLAAASSAGRLLHLLEPAAHLCASPLIQPVRSAGSETYDTMKTRIRQGNSAKANPPANTTRAVPPTVEDIRQRAHAIFLARGGTPGKELDDWLRAEQELQHERTRTSTDTTSGTAGHSV